MCHLSLEDPYGEARPKPGRKPRVEVTGLLDAVKTVASTATRVLAYGMADGDPFYDFDRYRDHQADARGREQAFFHVAVAQAEAGRLETKREALEAAVPKPAAAPDDGLWECPRSHRPLRAVTVAGIHMHVDTVAGGLMVERESQAYLLATPEIWPEITAVADRLARQASESVDGRALVYLDCPRCSGPMVRYNFERVSAVMVDRCPTHGTWYDADELTAALTFLADGGSDKKAAFEARESAYIAEEKARIRRIEERTSEGGWNVL